MKYDDEKWLNMVASFPMTVCVFCVHEDVGLFVEKTFLVARKLNSISKKEGCCIINR